MPLPRSTCQTQRPAPRPLAARSRPAARLRFLVPLVVAASLLTAALPASAQFNGNFALEKHTLDAENFLDWKAYQHPYPWRYEAYRAPNLFRATVGSLSQKVFYFNEEIRLEQDLGRYASVLYAEQEDSFFRAEEIYREVELRFGSGPYASVVGFPRAEKIQGHQGYALAWGERTDWNYVRLSRIEQYTLYNQENLTPARFAPEPVLHRLEARAFWNERVFLQVLLRDERPAALLTPDPDAPALSRRETYAGRKADAVLDVHWSERFLTGLHWRWHREQRSRAPLDAASSIATARQQLELSWADLYGVWTLSGGNVLEGGVYRGAFRNHIEAEAAAERFAHHLLTDAGYVFWTHPRSEWFSWLFSFQAGRADTLAQDGANPATTAQETTTELKAGAGFILSEAERYRFMFNTTWDLDLFAHRQWDGGNVQLLFRF